MNLLDSGYSTINVAKNIDILIDSGLVNIKRQSDSRPKTKKNTHASKTFNAPIARGLPAVLWTSLSILKSLISLITHPHERTSTEPSMTTNIFLKLRLEFKLAKKSPKSNGHNRRYIPIGLSILANSM